MLVVKNPPANTWRHKRHVVKNMPANAGDERDTGLIPGWEDPLEKEVHSSILAWKIPWTEKPGELWCIGLQRVRHN